MEKFSKFYKLVDNKRIYDYNMNVEDLFYSEIGIHFKYHLNLGAKIYYLQCSSKHNFFLNQLDIEYLSILYKHRDENLNYVFSENIKNIKCSQKNDLFFLTSLKNLYFVCLTPKLTNTNVFYFNLVIAVKSEFNVNQFFDWNLQSVYVKNVIELSYFNLNYEFIKNIFDLEKNKFRDNSISYEEVSIYQQYFSGPLNDMNSKLTKPGIRIYKKFIFKSICCHFYWMGSEYQFNDTQFWIDRGFKDSILILDKNNDLQVQECDHVSSLEDLMSCNEEYVCFQWWKIFLDL